MHVETVGTDDFAVGTTQNRLNLYSNMLIKVLFTSIHILITSQFCALHQ
jgi:hypothetical protein